MTTLFFGFFAALGVPAAVVLAAGGRYAVAFCVAAVSLHFASRAVALRVGSGSRPGGRHRATPVFVVVDTTYMLLVFVSVALIALGHVDGLVFIGVGALAGALRPWVPPGRAARTAAWGQSRPTGHEG